MKKFSFVIANYRLGKPGEYRGLFNVRSCGHYWTEREFRDFELKRDFLELYWCISGTGIFEHQDATYTLHPGEVCCYFPGEVHKIRASSDKWNYYWLTLDGPELPSVIEIFNLRQKPWQAGRCPVELFEKLLQILLFPNVYGMHQAALYAHEILSTAVNGPFTEINSQFEELLEEIENRYNETDFSICAIAEKFGIHRSTLHRLFVSHTGLSPQAYLMNYRLKEALEKIIAGMPVKSVAFECGFSDPGYFTRLFRKKYGITPTGLKSGLLHFQEF